MKSQFTTVSLQPAFVWLSADRAKLDFGLKESALHYSCHWIVITLRITGICVTTFWFRFFCVILKHDDFQFSCQSLICYFYKHLSVYNIFTPLLYLHLKPSLCMRLFLCRIFCLCSNTLPGSSTTSRQVGGTLSDANLFTGGVAAAPSMFTFANKRSSLSLSPRQSCTNWGILLLFLSICVLPLLPITANYWSHSFTEETNMNSSTRHCCTALWGSCMTYRWASYSGE